MNVTVRVTTDASYMVFPPPLFPTQRPKGLLYNTSGRPRPLATTQHLSKLGQQDLVPHSGEAPLECDLIALYRISLFMM